METMDQKDLIIVLRKTGLSYKDIAERTGTSADYARTVCSRANRKQCRTLPDGTCRYCGQPLIYTEGAKRKEFCDKTCRQRFYNQRNMRRPYIRTCEYCGLEFVAYGYPKKRFCSQECQTTARRAS